MRWLKRIGIAVLVLLLVGGGFTYYKLKEVGLIPREIYETVPPEIPTFSRPAILVLDKANGFIHKDAIPAANTMLAELAKQRGWDIFITENAASHNTEDLARFKVVVWNNVSGDVLTEDQRAALQQWIAGGGGWVGLHGSGGDFSYKWKWHVETLVGAQFIGHTMHPQFQDANVLVVNPAADITAHLQSPWRVPNEEWYAFDSNPRDKGYDILLALDESSYITRGKTMTGTDNMPGEHPIAWRHTLGQGRVFYNAIGHQAATYGIPEYRQLVANGIQWAMGD